LSTIASPFVLKHAIYPAPFPNTPQLAAGMNPAPLKVLDEGFQKNPFSGVEYPAERSWIYFTFHFLSELEKSQPFDSPT
jgi:hypothetical protein